MMPNWCTRLALLTVLLSTSVALAQEFPSPTLEVPGAISTIPVAGPGEIGIWGEVASFDATLGALQLRAHGFQLPGGRRASFADPKIKPVRLAADTLYTGTEEGEFPAAGIQYGHWVYVVGADEGAGTPLNARLLRNFGQIMPMIVAPLLPGSRPIIEARPSGDGLPRITVPAGRPRVEDRGLYASYVIRRFPLNRYSLRVSYGARGLTANQAVRFNAERNAVYAFGGGYFEPGSKRSIDYIVVNGREIDDYRWDWGRPVIAVKRGKVSIIRPRRMQDISGKYDHAIAVDYRATNRSKVVGRQIFGLTATEMIFVRCYSTEAAARRTMERLGVTDYVFLDGGSSTPPSARIPTRLVVVPRA